MNEETFLIYQWSDGAWCYPEELEEMGHMSDDYAVRNVRYDELEALG